MATGEGDSGIRTDEAVVVRGAIVSVMPPEPGADEGRDPARGRFPGVRDERAGRSSPASGLRGRPPARSSAELAELLRRAAALAGLEETVLGELAATTGTWLAGERRSSPATRRGYIADLAWWLSWACTRGLDVTDVSHIDADLYAAALRASGLAPATRSRRLSAVSSWYAYVARTGLATRNPFGDGMERPQRPRRSSTRGLSERELVLLLTRARLHESRRTYALLCLLIATAARITSVTTADIGDLGHDSGHRTIDLHVKGDEVQRLVLPPFTVAALDAYLQERGTPGPHEPLFATRTGGRIGQPYVFRLLRNVAKAAGIPSADDISPHSLRHSVATLLLGKGHPLHVVQDLLNHKSPNTTRIYDEDAGALGRSPAYELGGMLTAGIEREVKALRDVPRR